MQRTIILLIALLPLLFQIGCNRGPRKPEGLPKLYPVTLRLEQDGKPLAAADVILRSEEAPQWSCGGVSNEQGVVLVRTHGQFPGAPGGRHKVIVSKTEMNTVSVDISGAGSLAEIRELEAKAAAEQAATGYGSKICYVEREYSHPETTPLEINVVAGKNDFKLDVGPAVEIVEQFTSPMGR